MMKTVRFKWHHAATGCSAEGLAGHLNTGVHSDWRRRSARWTGASVSTPRYLYPRGHSGEILTLCYTTPMTSRVQKEIAAARVAIEEWSHDLTIWVSSRRYYSQKGDPVVGRWPKKRKRR